MNQTWENSKKPNFGPYFCLNLMCVCVCVCVCVCMCVWILYLYQILDIVASYHCMQFQGKLMNQTKENWKKSNFGSNFGPIFFFVDFTSTRC